MSSHSEVISINDILADVLLLVNDPEYKNGLGKGWYIRQISEAVEELAKDTFFQILTKDEAFPENLIMPVPANCFNVKELYLYSGVCGEPVNSRQVYSKRLFNNSQGGTNYTAKRKETMEADPFLGNGGESNLYYANVQNGVVMFGSTCSGYEFVRIVYYGLGSDIGEEPIIPRVFRQAIIDWVRVRVFEIFSTRDRTLFSALQTAILSRDGSRGNPGSWTKAMRIAKKMDIWNRENYDEYQARGNY